MKLGQWIGFLLFAAAIYILWEIRQILLQVFAAIVLANSLNILAQRLQKSGAKRLVAVLVAIATLFAALVVFFLLIVPSFMEQIQQVIELVPKGVQQLDDLLKQSLRLVPAQFSRYIPGLEELIQQIQPLFNRLLGGSLVIFSSSFGSFLNTLFILVLGIMMLVNPLGYRQGFIRLFPSFYRRRIDQILLECEVSLGRWIIGALISMTVVAVFSTIGLAIIGVPAALAQGVLAGLLNFIPNLGPAFSVVPPVLISFLDPDKPLTKALLVLGLYILIQQLESNFLTPYVMAQQVSLLPALTLLGQVFFATLFGFMGLLLAIPLVVVCQIWVRRVLVEDVLDRWQAPANYRQLASAGALTETNGILADTVLDEGGTVTNHQTSGTTGDLITQQQPRQSQSPATESLSESPSESERHS